MYTFVSGRGEQTDIEIVKRQRTPGRSERTYMSVQAIYLTFQVMEKDSHRRQKIINRMVQTTSVRNGAGKLEEKESDDVKDEVAGISEAPNT